MADGREDELIQARDIHANIRGYLKNVEDILIQSFILQSLLENRIRKTNSGLNLGSKVATRIPVSLVKNRKTEKLIWFGEVQSQKTKMQDNISALFSYFLLNSQEFSEILITTSKSTQWIRDVPPFQTLSFVSSRSCQLAIPFDGWLLK